MSATYQRSPNAIFSDVGDDVVALHVERGFCYGMENVTADVWKLLERPTTIEAMCAALTERYDVTPDICRAEVSQLLGAMHAEGLVETLA